MKVLTFGEIMLRLKAPGHERFFQSPMLEATFGGGEANVAVSLANYGMDAEFLTVLPQNDIADACIRELRYFGVDTKKIVRGDGRSIGAHLPNARNAPPEKAPRLGAVCVFAFGYQHGRVPARSEIRIGERRAQ